MYKSMIVFFLLFISCADSSSDRQSKIPDIEDDVSIAQGVYGQALLEGDVGVSETKVYQGFTVQIFTEAPDPDAQTADIALTSTETDEAGFYEIPLQNGEYCICSEFLRCAYFDLDENEIIRIDYIYGAGPGWDLDSIGCE